ncbi:zinc ribbon domain-containing protein [Desulfobulbus rhabdoformis]|jgi:ribosomal protein S8|uniref:zinc ribbon domain-containing protein n=1 Tax=Desulfobulbus rhabdoformis TaxID=34032 RepID=UPI0019657082|nr:zinc ribbon domain-containing protein [Desulfobulbus rhabdoformis]MBM9614240.1 zinc ribbon domain-containing protein [Desulfobulbus rhabdoformis]
MLSTVIKYSEEKHYCPHCSGDLTLCHAPQVHVGDGLGWGSEYLFICLNDTCPLFVKGWDYIANQYGHVGSYRYMEIPGSKETYTMMVAGKDAFTGSIVDIEALKKQNERYMTQKKALAALDTAVEEKNLEPVLTIILDESAKVEDRKRAIEMLPQINDLSCLDPLRNHSFRDEHLAMEVNLALKKVLEANFVKECPYCSELVKLQAKICKHCSKEL